MKKYDVSKRRVSNIFSTSRRRSYFLDDDKKYSKSEDELLEGLVRDKALNNPDYGYRMITASLKLDGYNYNHKRIYRIYKRLNLQLKTRNNKKRKIPAREKIYQLAEKRNEIWSLDFMQTSIKSSKVRTINIIDEYNREVLAIKANNSLPSKSVIDILEKIIKSHKTKPEAIRSDNGTEFTSKEFTNWAFKNKIALLFIQPGKPYQNCYIERFNGTYRSEILNKYIFDSIEELQQITDDWIIFYNTKRPHSSLGGLPPKMFK